MSKETTPIKEAEKLRSEIDGRLLYGVAADPATANTEEMYSALGLVSRAQLAKRWVETQKEDRAKKSRRTSNGESGGGFHQKSWLYQKRNLF